MQKQNRSFGEIQVISHCDNRDFTCHQIRKTHLFSLINQWVIYWGAHCATHPYNTKPREHWVSIHAVPLGRIYWHAQVTNSEDVPLVSTTQDISQKKIDEQGCLQGNVPHACIAEVCIDRHLLICIMSWVEIKGYLFIYIIFFFFSTYLVASPMLLYWTTWPIKKVTIDT